MKSFSMKFMEGLRVITSEGITNLTEGGFPALWDYFGWDIKNDKLADECATAITRQLICFGRVDLSEFAQGTSTLIVEVIPVDTSKTSAVSSSEEVEYGEQGNV